MTSDWSPSKYLAFADERTRPAAELLARVGQSAPKLVFDMGCGPGNSTALLKARFPNAQLIGLDTSPAMLEKARQALPDVTFEQADASQWLPPAETEVLFSNATYQWLPDHLEVLKRQLAALPAGAELAIQMPDNLDQPSHLLMAEVAKAGPWAQRLKDAPRQKLPEPGVYYDALAPLCQGFDIWHTVYNHVLDGPQAIVDWVSSTGLRPFLAPLDESEQAEYLSRYLAGITAAYPKRADGKVLLRFPRLFFVARK